MKNSIIFFYLGLLINMAIFSSCSKKDCCMPIGNNDGMYTTLALSVLNSDGLDLLDSTQVGAYKMSDILVEHLYHGEFEKKVYDAKSNRFQIVKQSPSGRYILVFPTNRVFTDDKLITTTVIKWNESITDTLELEWSKSGAPQHLWANKVLIWKTSGANNPVPNIQR